MVQNKALVFTAVPSQVPVAGQHIQVLPQDDFDLNASPPPGGFTAKVLHASFDPYLRHRMISEENKRDGFDNFRLGAVIENAVIVRVLQSDTPICKTGALLLGFAPIQEYISVERERVSNYSLIQNPMKLDRRLFLGALGMSGLAAYSALYEIGRPAAGETIFVSAASGAVGQIVGQLAKREGLRVIGSVGSEEKKRLLTDDLGFDAAFNYRNGDIVAQLRRVASEGIDSESRASAKRCAYKAKASILVYFDNVGGEQLDAALLLLKPYGRIVACGYASQYSINPSKQYGIRNSSQIIAKTLTWQGLNIMDGSFSAKYYDKHQRNVGRWIAEGSMQIITSKTEGIDNAATGLVELLEGNNIGKAVLDIVVGESHS